jgi:hypothetical protein
VPSIIGDFPETLGPVIAASAEYLDRDVPEMDLDAVAVELDLVEPARAAGIFSIDVASAGSMKPGNAALTPMAARFLRWNATNKTPCTTQFKLTQLGSFRMRLELFLFFPVFTTQF